MSKLECSRTDTCPWPGPTDPDYIKKVTFSRHSPGQFLVHVNTKPTWDRDTQEPIPEKHLTYSVSDIGVVIQQTTVISEPGKRRKPEDVVKQSCLRTYASILNSEGSLVVKKYDETTNDFTIRHRYCAFPKVVNAEWLSNNKLVVVFDTSSIKEAPPQITRTADCNTNIYMWDVVTNEYLHMYETGAYAREAKLCRVDNNNMCIGISFSLTMERLEVNEYGTLGVTTRWNMNLHDYNRGGLGMLFPCNTELATGNNAQVAMVTGKLFRIVAICNYSMENHHLFSRSFKQLAFHIVCIFFRLGVQREVIFPIIKQLQLAYDTRFLYNRYHQFEYVDPM